MKKLPESDNIQIYRDLKSTIVIIMSVLVIRLIKTMFFT